MLLRWTALEDDGDVPELEPVKKKKAKPGGAAPAGARQQPVRAASLTVHRSLYHPTKFTELY